MPILVRSGDSVHSGPVQPSDGLIAPGRPATLWPLSDPSRPLAEHNLNRIREDHHFVHLWKFDDDADRRAHWASVFANKEFVEGFAVKFRPLLVSQEVKLLTAAPWGPHP
jgi:NIPSNAP